MGVLRLFHVLLCNHLDGEDRADSLNMFVFHMSCDCRCSVALPHDAAGWSAVWDCGISGSCTHLLPYMQHFEMRHENSNNVVCATSKGSDQPANTRSLIRVIASRLNIL